MEEKPDPSPVRWFKQFGLPLTAIIGIALALCLLRHFSSITIDWSRTKDFTEALSNVVQVLALIAGGSWAYFKFAKGRTFQESLTPTIAARFALIGEQMFLVVSVQIKNVGLAKVDFNHSGSALILFEYTVPVVEEIHTVADRRLTSFDVFSEKDRYIEPNEIIESQRMISVPGGFEIGYRLELEVISISGYTWRATTIAERSVLRDNAPAELLGL